MDTESFLDELSKLFYAFMDTMDQLVSFSMSFIHCKTETEHKSFKGIKPVAQLSDLRNVVFKEFDLLYYAISKDVNVNDFAAILNDSKNYKNPLLPKNFNKLVIAAIELNKPQLLKFLLSNAQCFDHDTNPTAVRPIQIALKIRDVAAVQLLLEHEVDIPAEIGTVLGRTTFPPQGQNILHIMLNKSFNLKYLKQLLPYFDVNAKDDTPQTRALLHYAIIRYNRVVAAPSLLPASDAP